MMMGREEIELVLSLIGIGPKFCLSKEMAWEPLGQVHLGKHIEQCISLNFVRGSLRVTKKEILNLNKVSG